QQSALLDLLEGPDAGGKPDVRPPEPIKQPTTNMDLLDLLGGLDLGSPTPEGQNPPPPLPVQNNGLFNINQSSNFLVDGLLGSPSEVTNSKYTFHIIINVLVSDIFSFK
ncbi:unnamed protein product, partial [Timema podura]|nr:unnamed protein product [Timema podura]